MSLNVSWMLKTHGTVSFVSPKYAYVNSIEGTIYVATTCIINNQFEIDCIEDLLNENDYVYVEAIKQKEKNSCTYKATIVTVLKKRVIKKSKPSPLSVTPVSKDTIDVRVTNITQNYAFAHSSAYGDIFIPRNSFKVIEYIEDFRNFLEIDEIITVTIVTQREVNGCKFKSILSCKKSLDDVEEEFTGTGKIAQVEDNYCLTSYKNSLIRCPIITYCPNKNDIETDTLKDLFSIGDDVLFIANVTRKNGKSELRSSKWEKLDKESLEYDSSRIETLNLSSRRENTSDSYTQTVSLDETLILKSLIENHPYIIEKYEKSLEKLWKFIKINNKEI